MASFFFGTFVNLNWSGWLSGGAYFVTRVGVGASTMIDWTTACYSDGVVGDAGKNEGFWAPMLRVLFTSNFPWPTIFDLSLSIEDLVTFLWFGCPEKGGLERENPEGDSELVSLPFPSLIAMNSFSISDDFRFWFPIWNAWNVGSTQINLQKSKPKIIRFPMFDRGLGQGRNIKI